MNETLQRFDENQQNEWSQVLNQTVSRIHHSGLVLNEDKSALVKRSPESRLITPIFPEFGDPEVGAPLTFAGGELTVHSTRTTGKEYAVVQLALWLPVKRLIGCEVEFEEQPSLITASLVKREYALGFGGQVLEAYAFGLKPETIAQTKKHTSGPDDPFTRIVSLLAHKKDPGSNRPRTLTKRFVRS